MNKIYCIGGAAIDRKLQASASLIKGTSNPIITSCHFGGVARNVAENLIHWTTEIGLHTVVGEDEDGIQLLSLLKQKGIDIAHSIILKGARTANYYAILDHRGELYLSLADMGIYDQIPLQRFLHGFNVWDSGSILFMDTNLPLEIINTVMKLAVEKNLRLCIDPVSVSKSTHLPERLDGIYLLKPNPLEAATLTDMNIESIEDAMTAGQKLIRRGVSNVVITLGKTGYVIVNDDMREFISIDPIHDVINVNGAGDAYMAGIIYGLQQNQTLPNACLWGAAAAAFTVISPETVASGLTASKLQAFIHNQKIITGKHHVAVF